MGKAFAHLGLGGHGQKGKDDKTGSGGQTVMFVGYSFNRKEDSTRLWNPDTNCVYVSRGIMYLKRMFYKCRYNEEPINLISEDT